MSNEGECSFEFTKLHKYLEVQNHLGCRVWGYNENLLCREETITNVKVWTQIVLNMALVESGPIHFQNNATKI